MTIVEIFDQTFPLLPVVKRPEPCGHVLRHATRPGEHGCIQLARRDLASSQQFVCHADREFVFSGKQVDLDSLAKGFSFANPAGAMIEHMADFVKTSLPGCAPKKPADRVVRSLVAPGWDGRQKTRENSERGDCDTKFLAYAHHQFDCMCIQSWSQ